MKQKYARLLWIIAAGLFLLGLLIYTCLIGFSFSAYLCFAFGALSGCFGVLLHFWQKKAARILLWVLVSLSCLVLIAAIITGCLILRPSFAEVPENMPYIMVLGCGVNGDVPSLSLQERINAAYDYLSENPETICIVSGGQGDGENISEALCMYQHLTAMGIDDSRIWMEAQSTSTAENLRYSIALIEGKTGIRPERIGLLSSDYHLFRAGLVADAQNIAAVPIPAKTTWPSLWLNYFLREIVAVWFYLLTGGL